MVGEQHDLYPADASISLQVGELVDLVSATASVGLQGGISLTFAFIVFSIAGWVS